MRVSVERALTVFPKLLLEKTSSTSKFVDTNLLSNSAWASIMLFYLLPLYLYNLSIYFIFRLFIKVRKPITVKVMSVTRLSG